jgi:teichoic acid transport system ATP-binding protein
MMKPKVIFKNVSKKYTLYKKQSDKLLDALTLSRNQKDFFALKNVSFEVYEGETIGIIGMNGSGKSTLSNLLSKVVPPSSGQVIINGKPSLIAINTGLKPGLTGLDNIELKCLMHGLSKEEIVEVTPKIVEFADVGDFIDQPVKNYSSGMKSRLGFAISVHTSPDILIVDEALSVGDQTFYDKCIERINEFKATGKTIFYISHSLSQVRTISDRVIWVNHGVIEEIGSPKEVVTNYQKFIKWFNQLTPEEQVQYKKEKHTNQRQDNDVKDLISEASQSQNDLRYGKRSINKRKKAESAKRKKTKYTFSMQVLTLLLLVILSVTQMFMNKPLNSWLDNLIPSPNVIKAEKEVSSKAPEEKPKIEVVNKPAMVNVKNADLYADNKLTENEGQIPFASDVQVLEKADQVYKIKYEDRTVYTDIDNIQVLSEEISEVELSIQQLMPVFPKVFSESYHFYMAHLDLPSEEIKANIRGLTAESTDDAGNKLLSFADDTIIYHISDNGNSDSIILNSLNQDDEVIEELRNAAFLTSSDERLYYISIPNYHIVLDTGVNSLTLINKANENE